MNIIVNPLSPDLLEDFLFFFDNMVFTENPDDEEQPSLTGFCNLHIRNCESVSGCRYLS